MHYGYQHLDWRELANQLARDGRMDELFQQLMLVLNGDVEEALDQLGRLSVRYRQSLGFDVKDFEKRLREQKLITGRPGERKLSARGHQQLRAGSLEQVFGPLRAGIAGDHATRKPAQGARGEWNGAVRPWGAGDGGEDLAFGESWINHLRSGRDHLADDDLMIREREQTTGATTILGIDISHSMTLYGEDRITPAKRVALAYAELMRRQFPRDGFHVLLFGDDVREVSIADLATVTNGPFHTNTGEVLRRSAELLSRSHLPNKRVVLITDGKPTAIFRGVGESRRLWINSSYGLDPEIVTATLNQAARFPRLGIDLTVFMVATDPYLERFVSRLVEVAHGKAFHADLSSLGKQVLREMVNRRR